MTTMDMDSEDHVYQMLANASTAEDVKAALERCGCTISHGKPLQNPKEEPPSSDYPEEYPESGDMGRGPRRGAVVSIIVEKMGGKPEVMDG